MNNELIKYFQTHPAISITQIEIAAMGKKTGNLARFIKNGYIPNKHHWSLLRVLSGYGFKPGGWEYTWLEDTNTFSRQRPADGETTVIDKGDHFVYIVPYYRDFIVDEFDI